MRGRENICVKFLIYSYLNFYLINYKSKNVQVYLHIYNFFTIFSIRVSLMAE